ncbi:MAG: LPS export ABC transporter periplasmic protein LptC [Pseudomonadota bacterium]
MSDAPSPIPPSRGGSMDNALQPASATRALRLALPLAAIAVVSAVFIFASRSGIEDARSALVDGIALAGGLEVSNPRFSGVLSDGSPFRVQAAIAQPDGPDPERVTLRDVNGQLRLEDARELTITSSDGVFRPKDEVLNLEGDVVATTSDGYRLTSDRLDVDLATRSSTTPTAVRIDGPLGEITAERMDARVEEGLIANFYGDVRVVIREVVEPEIP